MMTKFQKFWKEFNKEETLSENEIKWARFQIGLWYNKEINRKELIKRLKTIEKLDENWKIQRVLRTETKISESREERIDAEDEDIDKFHIIPSPGACETCIKFSNNGKKVFSRKGIKKNGRNVPPIHPNCNCVLEGIYD